MALEWLLNFQIMCSTAVLVGLFALFAWWESRATWRPWLISRKRRWGRHIALAFISKVILRLFFPFLAIGTALYIQDKNMGLLNQGQLPLFAKIGLGLIAMDFVLYLQHRMMHQFTWLWWVHRVHHIDNQLDVSTGIRFHPLEELFTMAAKTLGIVFLGVPVIAVFIFEMLLQAALLYTHVNVQLKPKTELKLRSLIVTPGMHRIHHSDTPYETNSNYGFCLSVWDKLFGTYTVAAQTGEKKLVVGLEAFRDPKYQTLENMLLIPFNLKYLKVKPRKVEKLGFKILDKSIPSKYVEKEKASND